MALLDKTMKLPQVKKVTIEVIPPFDHAFISISLKKKSFSVNGVKWPEAIRAMYKNVVKAEHELLHIRSCCDKALSENIVPFKDYLWNVLNEYPNK